ncbi:MAG: tetratricopeptide repeat protein [Chloracidobacterium sp.]|nr:tetratricopeptide repeat protein [Chloracidobacterium sp.]MDW8217870.1 tetratricopeptide repeat protein [Acidobacteriota bacterium]
MSHDASFSRDRFPKPAPKIIDEANPGKLILFHKPVLFHKRASPFSTTHRLRKTYGVMTSSVSATEPIPSVSPASPTRPLRWLYNGPVDLIIGCGLWSLPLLLTAYLVEPHFTGHFAVAFYAVALVCNYPHYAATWYRACARPADRIRYGRVLAWSSLLTAAGLLLVHAHPPLLRWAFTLYVFWSPWHYTGQNYGLALMFARRNGVTALDAATTRRLWWAFALPYAMLLTAFNSGPSADPLLLSAGLPPFVAKTLIVVCGLIFLTITFIIGRKLLHESPQPAVAPTLTLLATQALWFIPAAVVVLSGETVFQVRYSSGMLAVLHSAQYLWVTSYYARRESGAQWRPGRYALVLFAVGVALFIPGPWAASLAFGMDFTTSFLAFTALVNIHHFILDGAVWKLREPQVAAVLVQDGAVGDVETTVPHRSLWRRFGLTAATTGLALLAGLDLAKFVLGGRTMDATSLQQALKLNPNDALIAARLARAALAEGDRLRAREALERAVAINPYDAESQAMLGQMLIEQGEYDAAYRHYQRFHEHLPNNVAALVNLGTLAAQQGAEGDAVAAWERAVQLDPNGQPIAWANLGDAYMRAGRTKEAAEAYEQALHHASPSDRQRLEWMLKLGDAYTGAQNFGQAETNYARVFDAAQAAGDAALASSAATRQAGLYAARQDIPQAVARHQTALQLAEASQDAYAQGAAWYEYALLMAKHGAPADFIYAACLLAETSFGETPRGAAVRPTVAARRAAVEQKLGPRAAEVRARLRTVSDEARRWRP